MVCIYRSKLSGSGAKQSYGGTRGSKALEVVEAVGQVRTGGLVDGLTNKEGNLVSVLAGGRHTDGALGERERGGGVEGGRERA